MSEDRRSVNLMRGGGPERALQLVWEHVEEDAKVMRAVIRTLRRTGRSLWETLGGQAGDSERSRRSRERLNDPILKRALEKARSDYCPERSCIPEGHANLMDADLERFGAEESSTVRKTL
jgi:hypothetical protein